VISDSLYDTLVQQPIVLNFKKASHNEGLAPYFREYFRGELKKWCSTHTKPNGANYNAYTDGLKVYTTINSRLQQFAEEGMRTHISSLQKDFNNHWKGYTKAPYPDDFEWEQIDEIIDQGMRRSERYRKLKKAGKSIKEIKSI
ncbi:MAG: penicillin-binding protein, partial [Flavobacteriales bacterium]